MGMEFDQEMSTLIEQLEDHESISINMLSNKNWEGMEHWNDQDVQKAEESVRKDVEWYSKYNKKLTELLLDDNIESLLIQLQTLDAKNKKNGPCYFCYFVIDIK